MIRFDVVTLFPEMFAGFAGYGIAGRAREAGLWRLQTWNPRDFTSDNYRSVDDRPYGGGPGMVMLAEPLEKTLDAVAQSQRGGEGTDALCLVSSFLALFIILGHTINKQLAKPN